MSNAQWAGLLEQKNIKEMYELCMLEIVYFLFLSCAEGKVYSDQNYRLKWIMSGDNGAAVNILAIFQLFRSTDRQFCHKIYSTLCLFVYLPILPQNNLSSISLSIFNCNKCFTSSKYPWAEFSSLLFWPPSLPRTNPSWRRNTFCNLNKFKSLNSWANAILHILQ